MSYTLFVDYKKIICYDFSMKNKERRVLNVKRKIKTRYEKIYEGKKES